MPARIATHLRLTNYPVRILRLERGERLDLQSRSVIEAIQNRSVVLFMGWQFRCYPLVLQHADAIRDFFRWDDATDSRVRDFMARARQNCDRLVGVHVRRGDYASFASGRYFFNDLQYARWMRQVIEQNNGRRIRFMICSDSAWDESAYKEFDCITGPGEMIEDMSALSHCDLIVGPPSTFTGWASFVGSVPCQHFHEIDEGFQESACEIYNLSEPRSLLLS